MRALHPSHRRKNFAAHVMMLLLALHAGLTESGHLDFAGFWYGGRDPTPHSTSVATSAIRLGAPLIGLLVAEGVRAEGMPSIKSISKPKSANKVRKQYAGVVKHRLCDAVVKVLEFDADIDSAKSKIAEIVKDMSPHTHLFESTAVSGHFHSHDKAEIQFACELSKAVQLRLGFTGIASCD